MVLQGFLKPCEELWEDILHMSGKSQQREPGEGQAIDCGFW